MFSCENIVIKNCYSSSVNLYKELIVAVEVEFDVVIEDFTTHQKQKVHTKALLVLTDTTTYINGYSLYGYISD